MTSDALGFDEDDVIEDDVCNCETCVSDREDEVEVVIPPPSIPSLIGEFPALKWKRREYLMQTIFPKSWTPNLVSLITGWYYSEFQISSPSMWEGVVGARRLEVARTQHQMILTSLAEFVEDYLFLSCLGEVRHGTGGGMTGTLTDYGAGKAKPHYLRCDMCFTHTKPASSQSREAAVATYWGYFAKLSMTRVEIFQWLIHAFTAHAWQRSIGGANWGYIAALGLDLHHALRGMDFNTITITLDKIIHAHHCTGAIMQSRYEWTTGLFKTYSGVNNWNIQRVAAFKAIGGECCWNEMRGVIPKWAVFSSIGDNPEGKCSLGVENCIYCPNYNPHKEENAPQLKWTLNNPIRDKCNECAYPVTTIGICVLKCPACGVHVQGWKGLWEKLTPEEKTLGGNVTLYKVHAHSCNRCYQAFANPDNPRCTNWCVVCNGCASDWGHNICHLCLTNEGHKQCLSCYHDTRCPKAKMCTRCFRLFVPGYALELKSQLGLSADGILLPVGPLEMLKVPTVYQGRKRNKRPSPAVMDLIVAAALRLRSEGIVLTGELLKEIRNKAEDAALGVCGPMVPIGVITPIEDNCNITILPTEEENFITEAPILPAVGTIYSNLPPAEMVSKEDLMKAWNIAMSVEGSIIKASNIPLLDTPIGDLIALEKESE